MKVTHENMMNFVLESIGVDAKRVKAASSITTWIPPFSAGRVKESEQNEHGTAVAHLDIELRALGSIFSEDEIMMIYYGNWLRDYSQVLVPGMVGFKMSDREFFTNAGNQPEYSSEEVKALIKEYFGSMHKRPSIDTWVGILEFLATKEFVYNRKEETGQKLAPHYKPYHDEFKETYGHLTIDMLGIYRPEEHIDNPHLLVDQRVFSDKELEEPIRFVYSDADGNEHVRGLFAGDEPKQLQVDLNKELEIKPFIKGYDDPSNPDQFQTDEKLRAKKYDDRPSSFTFFRDQMFLAAKAKKKRDRLRYFGAALHVLEDYFAHTNFVEIALIKLDAQISPQGSNEAEESEEENENSESPPTNESQEKEKVKVRGTINVFPWVDLPDDVKEETDGLEKAKRIPVVTGTFGNLDTIASIVPKLRSEVFDAERTPYQEMKYKQRTISEKVTELILDDLSEKEIEINEEEFRQEQQEEKGFLREAWEWAFEPKQDVGPIEDARNLELDYLRARDSVVYARDNESETADEIIEDGLESMHYAAETFGISFNILMYMASTPADGLIKEYQGLMKSASGHNPSHTQVAKDDAHHEFNPLAGILAIKAVNEVGIIMKSVWETNHFSVDDVCDLVKGKYFTHPCQVDWMDEDVIKWAKENPDAIRKSENATRTGHALKETGEYLKESTDYLINNWSSYFKWRNNKKDSK